MALELSDNRHVSASDHARNGVVCVFLGGVLILALVGLLPAQQIVRDP